MSPWVLSCALTGCPNGISTELTGCVVSITPALFAFQPCTRKPFVGFTSSPVELMSNAPSRVKKLREPSRMMKKPFP